MLCYQITLAVLLVLKPLLRNYLQAHTPAIDPARQQLNCQPTVPLEQGMAPTSAFFRNLLAIA